ncbi:MAG: hypothetical protein GY854_26275 [Deltaproteobacteria bacterium]|nr:hypothetical protein [Deltaproteobacteria bacterium]
MPPYVSISLQGDSGSATTHAASERDVSSEGTMNLGIGNAGIYKLQSGVKSFWVNTSVSAPAKGEYLRSFVAWFVMPTTVNGQDIPVSRLNWSTTLDGDQTAARFPVEAR